MAKPDCDDGWLKYAHELDAALAVADFTKGARIVLREIFAQLFGPARLKTARVSPTELARCTGQVKTGLVRSVRELIESDVLRKRPDGSYAFNKDYESWVIQGGRGHSSGSPRLSRDEVIYCRNAPVRAMAYKAGYNGQIQSEQGNQTVTEGNPIVTPAIVDEVTKLLPDGNQIVTAAVTGSLPDVAPPPAPPLVNGRAEFETRETIETQAEERASVPSDPSGGKPAKLPTNFAPDLGTATAMVSGPGKDSPEAIALGAWAEQFGADRNRESYAVWSMSACNYVPASWVRALLRNKVDGRSDRKGLAYLNSILGDWMNEGECEYLKPRSSRRPAGSAPSPPPDDYKPATAAEAEDIRSVYEAERRQAEEKKARQRSLKGTR